VLAAQPDNREALKGSGWCHSRNRRHAEAIARYSRLHELEPKRADWPYALGYQYYDQKSWPEAIAWFDKALALRPDFVVVLYRKGYAHQQLEHFGPALQAYSTCRDAWHRMPDGPAREKDRKNCAKAAYHQGALVLENPRLVAGGSPAMAAAILEEAVGLDPADGNHQYKLGAAYIAAGRPSDALAHLREADRLTHGKDYVLDRLGQAYMALDNAAECLGCYDRVPPPSRKAYYNRNYGKALLKFEMHSDAERTLRRAVQQERSNHNGHFCLAQALECLGRVREAAIEYQQAVALRKKNYGKDFPEASAKLDRIREIHPDALEAASADRGVVESYNSDRGFGFIRADDGERRFFHIKECIGIGSPAPGVRVRFEPAETPKGLAALRVGLE